VTEEHDGGDNRQESEDGTGDLPGRDLGAGHPLSADTDGQPLPSDTDAELPADDGGAGPAGATDTDGPGETAESSGEESGPGVSRRGLLLGAGAGAVAASLGWAAVLGVGGGGPDGAEAVAVDYVNAVADNDWAAAGALFHPDSEFAQDNLTYEEYLRDQQQLEGYRSVEPSIDGQYTFRHIADAERAAQSEGVNSLFQDEIDLADIDEAKQIIVIASVREENLNRTEAQRESLGDEPTISFSVSVVRDGAGWQIAQVFGGTSV
jgi:hypothetical protein